MTCLCHFLPLEVREALSGLKAGEAAKVVLHAYRHKDGHLDVRPQVERRRKKAALRSSMGGQEK